MFDKRFVCTVLAVLAVTAGSAVWISRTEKPSATPMGETLSGVEQEVEPAAQQGEGEAHEPEYPYMIREYEGRVAVFFAENEEEPEIIYDTLVKYLPDYDQHQLKQGIPVSTYQELVSLIEDYVS